MRSERVDAFAAAMLSQQLAGGDLAGLLRRFAAGAAERDRVAEDARSATAQARFTGLLVVAMPSGGALFAELVQPGFLAKLVSSPASAVMLALAAALQLAGFVAIRRSPGGRVSGAGALAALAVLLGFAAARELAASRTGLGPLALPPAWRGRSATAGLRLGLPERLARAGLEHRLPLGRVLLAKMAAGLAALWSAWPPRPAAPGGLGLLVASGSRPRLSRSRALLEREARRRRASPRRGAARRARPARGRRRLRPRPRRGARASWRGRRGPAGRGAAGSPSPNCPAVLRSAPCCARCAPGPWHRDRDPRRGDRALPPLRLAARRALRRQGAALRRDGRRAVEERAARAAPKIQLVVALVLVPSVLLMIAAALIANAATLLSGF